jgi:Tol biopolymer transport system component
LIGSDWAAHFGSGHLLFLDGKTLMAQPFDPARLELIGPAASLLREVAGSSTGHGSFSVSATGVVAYTKGQFNRSEVRWVDRSGTPGPVVLGEADYADFSLSPDQTRLAYSLVDEQTQAPDVWILDMVRGTPARITSERLVDTSPIWSPDGNEILFRSNRSSSVGVELYRTSASPGGSTALILGAADVAGVVRSNLKASHWLPDGRILFWHATPDAGYGIWSVSSTGDDPKMILETSNNELQAAVSPDGRWMAYASNFSGHYEVYVQDFPAGNRREVISKDGGTQPQWRGDGRELYYLGADGSIMQVAVAGGDRFSAAPAKPLFKTTNSSAFNPYRMDFVPAADGKRFLVRVPVSREAPAITVVLNWPALLAK